MTFQACGCHYSRTRWPSLFRRACWGQDDDERPSRKTWTAWVKEIHSVVFSDMMHPRWITFKLNRNPLSSIAEWKSLFLARRCLRKKIRIWAIGKRHTKGYFMVHGSVRCRMVFILEEFLHRWASAKLGQNPDAVNLWIGDERSVTSIHSGRKNAR